MDELVSTDALSWDYMNPTSYIGNDINWFMCSPQAHMMRINDEIVNEFYTREDHRTQLIHLICVTTGGEWLNLIDRTSHYITDMEHQPWLVKALIDWKNQPSAMELFIEQSPSRELKEYRQTLWQLLK